jgi:hypothetical protein
LLSCTSPVTHTLLRISHNVALSRFWHMMSGSLGDYKSMNTDTARDSAGLHRASLCPAASELEDCSTVRQP